VPVEVEPDEGAMAAARWAIANGRAAGRGTDTLPALAWQFRPMRGARSVVGLLGIKLSEDAGALDAERSKALDALLDQAVIALERAELMEERARGEARSETEALRTALLTSLGHDLKTPLTSIRGAIGTLRASGESLAPAARDDLLLTAEEETARLTRWIANILDMVRIENRQTTPRLEMVDLAEAAESAALRAARATGRHVGRDLAPGLVAPRLDPVLLGQVLANLLDNAQKFSGPEGLVMLRTRRDGADGFWSSRMTGQASPAPTCIACSIPSSAPRAPIGSPPAAGSALRSRAASSRRWAGGSPRRAPSCPTDAARAWQSGSPRCDRSWPAARPCDR
jgi:two-component system sensor histidine kinase KdpD